MKLQVAPVGSWSTFLLTFITCVESAKQLNGFSKASERSYHHYHHHHHYRNNQPKIFDAACKPNTVVKIPQGVNPEISNKFPFVEAGLQIFLDITVPCSGYLNQWRFLAASSYIVGLHLGIFRRSPKDPKMIRLVGETYIDQLRVPTEHVHYWVKYSTYSPLKVKQGDFIGFFYDRLNTPTDVLTIASKHCDASSKNNRNTIVLLRGQKDFNATGMDVEVDTNFAYTDCRKPALMAVIVDALKPSAPTTTTTTAAAPSVGQAFFGKTTKNWKPVTPKPVVSRVTVPTKPTKRTTTTAMVPLDLMMAMTTTDDGNDGISLTDSPLNLLQMTTNTPWTDVTVTLPKPIVMAGIAARCFHVPTMLEACTYSKVRSFFDYKTGTCSLFYGCEDASPNGNNFATLDECIVMCERHTRPYQDAEQHQQQQQHFITLPPPVIPVATELPPTTSHIPAPVGPFESIFYGGIPPNYGLHPIRRPTMWTSDSSNNNLDNNDNNWMNNPYVRPPFWKLFGYNRKK